jgi:hypothetical protein
LQEITDKQFVLTNAKNMQSKEEMLYVGNLKNIVFCAELKHKVLFVWVQIAEKYIIKFIRGRNKELRIILEQVVKKYMNPPEKIQTIKEKYKNGVSVEIIKQMME